MSYSSPVSSITEQAERAVANARFSTVGRRFLGPRLPIHVDYNQVSPEVILACVQTATTLGRVMDAHGAVPPGTLGIIVANVLVFIKPDGVAFGELDRVVKSAFVHRDLFHLLANMTGVLEDGSYLESREGTASFLTRAAVLLAMSQGTLVALSYSERKLAGYGSGGASSWLNDAVSGVTGRRFSVGGAEMLPFYNSGVVGFSGVNYALKVVACHKRRANTFVYLLGILPVPVRYSFWFELAMGTMIMPSSGTFAAHFAGTVAGLMSVYVPRIAGFGALGRGRGGRNRAYSGRGQRLGGRYLREDEPADTRSASTRGGGDYQQQQRQQPQQSFSGGGRRLGDGSGDSGGRGGRSRSGRGRGGGGVENAARSLWKLLASPFVMLKGAVDEGAPLVVHGGFAMACVLLQQIMSRQMPEGLLSKMTMPRTFERGVSFR